MFLVFPQVSSWFKVGCRDQRLKRPKMNAKTKPNEARQSMAKSKGGRGEARQAKLGKRFCKTSSYILHHTYVIIITARAGLC